MFYCLLVIAETSCDDAIFYKFCIENLNMQIFVGSFLLVKIFVYSHVVEIKDTRKLLSKFFVITSHKNAFVLSWLDHLFCKREVFNPTLIGRKSFVGIKPHCHMFLEQKSYYKYSHFASALFIEEYHEATFMISKNCNYRNLNISSCLSLVG